jgi:valyl-tRNA synthetase
MNVPPAAQVEVFLQSADEAALAALGRHCASVLNLARLKDLHSNAAAGAPAAAAKAVVETVEIFMPLAGVIDFGEEVRRLEKEMEKLSKDLTQAQRKLANEDFRQKAPPEVVAKEEEKVEVWKEKLSKLQTHRERIRELLGGEK